MCCRVDCKVGRRTACFHSKCYDFRLHTVSLKFLATTEYSFRPPISEERRRRDRILRILTRRLSVSWTIGLPDEICQMIAGYLIRECATVTAQELANKDSPDNSIINLSHDVYVRYITIEGIRYIYSLRNATQSTIIRGETLLLDSQKAREAWSVHVAEDHLGIRYIQTSPSPKSRLPGLWWRKLSGPQSRCILTKTDVSLRKDSPICRH